MQTLRFEYRRSEGRVYFWIVPFLLIGCGGEPEKPRNPAVDVLETAPTEVSHEHVTECRILVDGEDLSEGVTVVEGSVVRIGGTMILDRSKFAGERGAGNVHIRMHPVGTPPERWDGWEFAMEWVGPINEELDFEQAVSASPGEYEARVFAIMFGPFESLPKFELVGSGRVTIEPAMASE